MSRNPGTRELSFPAATDFRSLMTHEGESLPVRRFREEAMRRFEAAGLPTTRVEEWRYTNLAPLARGVWSRAEKPAVDRKIVEEHSFGEEAVAEIVFINGFLDPSSSRMIEGEGVTIRSIGALLQSESMSSFLDTPAQGPLVDLNAALVRDGVVIDVAEKADASRPVHLLFLYTNGAGSLVNVRNRIVAGALSRLRIVESHIGLDDSNFFVNSVTTIEAASATKIEHSFSQHLGKGTKLIATIHGLQQRDSSLRSSIFSFGGEFVRNDVTMRLEGEGSELTMDGLYLLSGDLRVDNHTVIDHAAPHTNSTELYKGILGDRSNGIFDGKIIVRKNAQQTNSRQTNHNLLLSNEAVADSKPQLEIHADDVKCAHGSTIGQINEDSLFYLQARGIGRDDAKRLLMYAFASEIVERVEAAPLRKRLESVLLARMDRA